MNKTLCCVKETVTFAATCANPALDTGTFLLFARTFSRLEGVFLCALGDEADIDQQDLDGTAGTDEAA